MKHDIIYTSVVISLLFRALFTSLMSFDTSVNNFLLKLLLYLTKEKSREFYMSFMGVRTSLDLLIICGSDYISRHLSRYESLHKLTKEMYQSYFIGCPYTNLALFSNFEEIKS